MSFKIRPNHERNFAAPSSRQSDSDSTTEVVEDVVFVVDEDTGEIREEKQMVERVGSSSSSQPAPNLPRKDSARIQPLAMKKRTKVSFM